MHLWVCNVCLPPYELYNPCDGCQETVTIPSKPRDVLHTVRRRDSLYLSITRIMYGRNHIRLQWPALAMSLAVLPQCGGGGGGGGCCCCSSSHIAQRPTIFQ
jgi:hypothetical protein